MPSIESVITAQLVNNGLFPAPAAAVMEAVKADPANEVMIGRWTDDVEGYPPQIMAAAWYSAKHYALVWIDANCPKACFRPIFAGD